MDMPQNFLHSRNYVRVKQFPSLTILVFPQRAIRHDVPISSTSISANWKPLTLYAVNRDLQRLLNKP